jgi:predicted RNase H-like nuclease (RuvC/YqgF family)
MPRVRVLLIASVLAVSVALPARAQTADEKELAAYTLTMPTLKKVAGAMRAMAKEASQDPKYRKMMDLEDRIAALDKQLDALSEKDELTPAEEKKVESLSAELERLREEKQQAEDADDDNAMENNAQTISEMEQNIRKFPPMARALQSQGLTPREFSKFMLAMLQASMVYGFSQGKVDYAKLPPGVNPANVKFIETHKAELEAMQKELSALNRR